MDIPAERNAAYTEFLAGLADLRDDVATVRFDASVAALEAQGRLDRGDAARLRYWQRESLRTQSDQLIGVASASLAALDRARAQAVDAVTAAEAVWDLGRGAPESSAAPETTVAPDSALAPTLVPDPPPVSVEPDATDPDPGTPLTIVLVPSPTEMPPTDGVDAEGAATDPDPPITVDLTAPDSTGSRPIGDASDESVLPASRGRHRAPAHASPLRLATTDDPGSLADTSPHEVAPTFTGGAPARRRRLLVAGLTVVDNSDVPPDSGTGEAPATG